MATLLEQLRVSPFPFADSPMSFHRFLAFSIAAVALLLASPSFAADETFDVVLRGGRVVDPESRLDAVRNVGIRDGTIRAVSVEPLSGRTIVDAAGLVVAPG